MLESASKWVRGLITGVSWLKVFGIRGCFAPTDIFGIDDRATATNSWLIRPEYTNTYSENSRIALDTHGQPKTRSEINQRYRKLSLASSAKKRRNDNEGKGVGGGESGIRFRRYSGLYFLDHDMFTHIFT